MLDVGFDAEIDEDRVLHIYFNTPTGKVFSNLSLHPELAEKLRDWLVANVACSNAGKHNA